MECFVCSESTPPLYKVCDCNTIIHQKCFEKLVTTVTSHQNECAICKKQYDLKNKIKEVIVCRKTLIALSLLILSADSAILCLLLTIHLEDQTMNTVFQFAMYFSASIITISGVVIYYVESKKHNSLLCFSKEKNIKKEISLPIPIEIVVV